MTIDYFTRRVHKICFLFFFLFVMLLEKNAADQAFLNTRTNDNNNINNIPLKSLFTFSFADWTKAPRPAANEFTIMLCYYSFSRTLWVSPAA